MVRASEQGYSDFPVCLANIVTLVDRGRAPHSFCTPSPKIFHKILGQNRQNVTFFSGLVVQHSDSAEPSSRQKTYMMHIMTR